MGGTVILDNLLREQTISCFIVSKIKKTQEWYYNPGKYLIILTLICVGFIIIGERIGALNNWSGSTIPSGIPIAQNSSLRQKENGAAILL